MRLLGPILLFGAWQAIAGQALIQDRTHESAVFGETRHFRIFLPPDYETSGKRYPVIYWFHGHSERYNKPPASRNDRNYDVGEDYGGDNIANFVGTHPVIVVKWDGYNPRKPDENYPRPYNISPVETSRQFPLYFPELVEYIDANFRTIADREHRATAGLSMGGFMSFWVSGKYPDLVSSASNFMGSSEFYVGPRGFDVEYRHDEMRNNYDGLRTRLVTGTKDFIRFYHQQMNAIWRYTRDRHETEEFDFDHGTPGMAKTLEFHMRAFADPLPRPEVWSHNDVYPNFSVWGWSVVSNRRRPGITVLENVSRQGFRSSVREWLYGGKLMPDVRLQFETAKLFPPRSHQTVTAIRLRDGSVRRLFPAADSEGRLDFDLDGDEYEVGFGSGSVLALAGYQLADPWAQAGKAVKLRARIWNKGSAPSVKAAMTWMSANPALQIENPAVNLPVIEPGKFIDLPLVFTVNDENRVVAKLFLTSRTQRLPLEVPLFPPAENAAAQIADGKPLNVYQHAVKQVEMTLGEGNGDGQANAGETIAVVLDGRAAELFTNDSCVDLSNRVSDVWSEYDHVGASAKYSLPAIRKDCPAGHVIRAMGRIVLPNRPNHSVRYFVTEIAVR